MDSVRRFLFEQLDIRGSLVSLGATWHDLQAERNDPPAVTALFGQLAAVTALLAGNLKTPGRLTFQLQGRGPVSLLMVDCDEQLRLRGTVRHTLKVDTDETATCRELLGDGQLVLSLQTGHGDPYQSIVPLVGDSIAAIFEHYLLQSEQQPAHLFLSADESFAGCLFLQRLPRADERDPDGWNRLTRLAATLTPAELREPAATLLMHLFAEEEVRLFEPHPVRYHCPRNEEKVLAMLRSLGRVEIEATLAEHGEVAVEDDICRQHYRWGHEIIRQLFD